MFSKHVCLSKFVAHVCAVMLNPLFDIDLWIYLRCHGLLEWLFQKYGFGVQINNKLKDMVMTVYV